MKNAEFVHSKMGSKINGKVYITYFLFESDKAHVIPVAIPLFSQQEEHVIQQ